VREYNPNVTALTDTNDYSGVNKATLTAPTGFLISNGNRPYSNWTSAIEISLSETQSGEETYYLCNNDTTDTEYYQAISTAKAYKYSSVQTKPEIESIKVEKVDANTTLNFLTFGVFGNGSVKVIVEAVGTAIEQKTTIYLGEDGGVYDSKVATSELKSDGKYHYIAEFTFDDMKSMKLKAYASNSSGDGNKSARLNGISDTDGSSKTVESQPLILDDVKPDVTIGTITSDHESTKSEISISDIDSGIAKVEYGWDLDRSLCDDEENSDSGHYLGFKKNNYSNQYVNYDFNNSSIVNNLMFTLELKHNDSVWAKGNQHTVYIKVTDNAGNTYNMDLSDPVGSDMLPPNITSVEIRKAETSTADSILRFLTFGIFSNDSVEIVVTADDNQSIKNSFYSGVKTVSLNGTIMEKKVEGEYALTVSPDKIINAMSITIEDKVGWEAVALITEIPNGKVLITSNDLIVESYAPTISWELSSSGYTNNLGDIWYGTGDAFENIKIISADKEGTVNSGLYSVKINDNDVTIFEKSSYSLIDLQDDKTFTMGDLSEGLHKVDVFVEDNAGNKSSDTKTFHIDCTVPESGTISITSPNSVTIGNKQWFDKGDAIYFRVDASDADSGLDSINIKVNDREFNFSRDEILVDETGCYVTFDTENLATDFEHKYTVSGTVTDIARNSLTLEPLTVYIDFENPTIDKFTVEKNKETINKVLNLLTFGTYSHDTLIFKVKVSDAEFDSGIDHVNVLFDDSSVPKAMENEGDGVFSLEIKVAEEVFQSNIIVTAYDKYGKESLFCPNLESTENDSNTSSKFVMIERVKPVMTLDLPTGDGVTRTDGQTWYNSNKPVSLYVQDEHSGIRSIDLKVNGIDIAFDKKGKLLLRSHITEKSENRNNIEQGYNFDTDFFTSRTGKPSDGKYVINVKVTDNSNNITTYETTYYIDKIAPKIDEVLFTPTTADGIGGTSKYIEKLDYGFYFKIDFTVVINAFDESPSSGLNEVKYRFVPYQDGIKQAEILGTQKIANGKAMLTIPKGFKGQIFIEAFDNVLNRSGEITTNAYIVDNTVPDINIIKNTTTPYKDAVGSNLYVVDNSITVEVVDTVSGIKEIGYSQSAEINSFDRKIIIVNNSRHYVGEDLGDGWIVTAIDENLVTKVTKTLIFSSDDNDVILTFDATDNSLNKNENVKSERFTIDKTSPIINIVFRDDEDSDLYYNQNRIADITVIDRNFDASRIEVIIENQYGRVPTFTFSERTKSEHIAVIEFDEGDYTFNVRGTDLGNHTATVNFSGGNENQFYVDKTKPVIEDNFSTFTNNSTENSFNIDKAVTIKVTEHNFAPELAKLRITRKEAGANHDVEGLEDVTAEVLGNIAWESSGDIHTISFTINRDAVYQVEIAPSDLARNVAELRNTVVFEIDKTIPVVTAKNEKRVSDSVTELLDIYPYSRKDDSSPTVEFDDLNINHIKYVLTVYTPSLDSARVIKPVRVYLNEDKDKSGIVMGRKITLSDFVSDGIYSLELIAVDIAGNESLVNTNTYARMVEQDVLAYIMESNVANKTGLYSFQHENGDAISKRPDNFSDIKILVLAKKDTDVDIVLRDSNGDEINSNAQATTDDSVYGIAMHNYTLSASFFKENFQDDVDVQLHLTVKNEDNRIDLGKLHIDNIAPTCDIPKGLKSWQWYYGEDTRTITINNISELLDQSQCKVYDNGKEIEFEYSSEENKLAFTLDSGWHNVGIVLDDMAGNAYNIQEATNIHIGFFWLWIIIASSVLIIGVVTFVIIRNKRKRRKVINV